MNDHQKTREQLIAELADLRRRVAELDACVGDESGHWRPVDTPWHSLVANTPVFIHILDRDCCIRFANHTDSGATPDRILGKPLYDFCRPEDRVRVRECVERVFRTGEPGLCEGRGLRLDEEEHWYASHFGPICQGGKVVAVSAVSINITDRKQAEQTLQDSEERFRKVFEEGPMGVVLVSLDFRIQRVNRHFCDMLGYSEDEIIALGLVGITHPEDYQRDSHLGSSLRRGEIPSYTIEKRYLHKDGRVVWGQLTVSLMHDEAGRPINTIGMVEHITEKKRAEEALRASEAKYRRLHQSMMDAFVSVDMDGFIREYNEAYCTMLGYEPEELLTLRYVDVTPEKWRSYEAEIVRKQILPQGHSDTYEKEYRRKDGTIFPVELRTFLIKDDHGQPCAMWAIVRDITERKQAEAALQKAHDELEQQVEERTAELAVFRRFAEAAGQGFGMADLDGHITYANPTLCRMFGEQEPEHVVGKHLATYYPAGYMEQRQAETVPAVYREGHWEGERTILSRQGTQVPTLHHNFLIRDAAGQPMRLAAVITDISERKHAEEALRESEEKYRSLVDTSPDGVIMLDVAGRILFASEQVRQMHGSDRVADLLERSSLDFIAPEDHPRFFENLARTLREGVTRNVEYSLLRRDGTHFAGEVSAAALKDRAGEPRALVAILRDITERKQAEEALQREQRTLRHMLQASDRERRLVAYDIHDGLAQELAAAIMQFQTYERLQASSPADAARAYAAGMTMLSQSHCEARRLISGLTPPVLDEDGVIVAIGHLIHEQLGRTGLVIDYYSRVTFDRLVPVLENSLYRIAQEGLANACKHSNSERVAVALVQHGDRVRLLIRDWGIGFQPGKVRKGRYGLDGIRQRARLLGGKCRIRSAAGKGTRIVVELPVMERE